ncbi:MAG TPA: HAD-IA family hydrolase [Candidatus Acidoferrales bacterium]|jgi:putative hydrolase of the HAD superfamily|nr:HAD-IA family hydrolase [Candidatus Acidoferrales bacterium]
MSDVTALFWDVGGVILSNGWDRRARAAAAQTFGIDWEEFQDRHELASPAFETGRITLDTYLQRTVFYRKRSFTAEEFTNFVFAQSEEFPETRAVLADVAATGRYLQATINNEPLELNERRIRQFNLRLELKAFFSSCYLGVRKPDEGIYKLALEVTQRGPDECVFIDDRELNLECAQQLRMRTIQFKDAVQLRRDLVASGVRIADTK